MRLAVDPDKFGQCAGRVLCEKETFLLAGVKRRVGRAAAAKVLLELALANACPGQCLAEKLTVQQANLTRRSGGVASGAHSEKHALAFLMQIRKPV